MWYAKSQLSMKTSGKDSIIVLKGLGPGKTKGAPQFRFQTRATQNDVGLSRFFFLSDNHGQRIRKDFEKASIRMPTHSEWQVIFRKMRRLREVVSRNEE